MEAQGPTQPQEPDGPMWPSYRDDGDKSDHLTEPLTGVGDGPRRMDRDHLDHSRIRRRLPEGVFAGSFGWYHTQRSIRGLAVMLGGLLTSLVVANLYWLIAWSVVALAGLVTVVRDTMLTSSWMFWTGHDRDIDVL